MDVKLKPYSDPARWVAIYPLYINATKSLAQGRRIAKAKAVDNPTCQEIFDVLSHAGFRCSMELAKVHPRVQPRGDPQQRQEGRVRVQLRDDEDEAGTAVATAQQQPQQHQFMSRHQLLLYAAEMIPKLKTRQQQGDQQQNDSAPKQKKRK
uniref:Signal recognition particle 19 kDa protein n=1 Tax=Globodera rostochiensis TaxID=31243 RepID=A0A914I1J7_GLORO